MSSENFFNAHHIISELKNNCKNFKSLLATASPQEYLWKPSPDKWCLLEIVCHLYDEEREDFRARLQHVLTTPDLPMSEIDPVGWVTGREYINQNYSVMLEQFLDERQRSINWLHSLVSPDYKQAYVHPKFGVLSGKLFLANWLAHDYLHIRQITKLKYDYLKIISGLNLKYAGDW